MSEQIPKSEVDEVLNAVKRLVSAPAAQTAPATAPEPAPDGLDERLLLTPSLRVEQPVNDPGPIQPAVPDAATDTDDAAGLEAEGHSLEDRIAELEAAVGKQDIDFEPDGSELVDEETPRRFVFQHRPVEDFDAPWVLEPAVETADSTTEAEPPAADKVVEPPSPVEHEEPVEEAEPIPLRADRTDEGVFDVVLEPEGAAPSEAVEASDDRPGTLEIAEDLEIDEDMLRDIVAEIVRSELQGELGERITRNVRKLVRREIHRAIMTRDFS